MTTRRPAVAIPGILVAALAGAILLGACGGDDEESTDSTITSIGAPATLPASTVADTTIAAATTISVSPTDTVDIPPAPVGTADIPIPPPVDTSDLPIIISVVVGSDSAPDRIETVPLGSIVTIALTNPAAAEEYHLHDYELGDDQVFEPGQTATFTFAADQAGDFELESHITEDVLMVLRVV